MDKNHKAENGVNKYKFLSFLPFVPSSSFCSSTTSSSKPSLVFVGEQDFFNYQVISCHVYRTFYLHFSVAVQSSILPVSELTWRRTLVFGLTCCWRMNHDQCQVTILLCVCACISVCFPSLGQNTWDKQLISRKAYFGSLYELRTSLQDMSLWGNLFKIQTLTVCVHICMC